MNDEKLTNVSAENVEGTDVDYINALNELKSSTVSKEKYMKLKGENKKLLDALVSGNVIEQPVQKPKADINAIRKELFNVDAQHSNLEYIQLTLDLRNALPDAGEPDPFLPFGSRLSPTAEDIQDAENAAQIYQECIDYANGDTEVFTNELMRRTVDAGPTRNVRRR
jgi:hypothetical protein